MRIILNIDHYPKHRIEKKKKCVCERERPIVAVDWSMEIG